MRSVDIERGETKVGTAGFGGGSEGWWEGIGEGEWEEGTVGGAGCGRVVLARDVQGEIEKRLAIEFEV